MNLDYEFPKVIGELILQIVLSSLGNTHMPGCRCISLLYNLIRIFVLKKLVNLFIINLRKGLFCPQRVAIVIWLCQRHIRFCSSHYLKHLYEWVSVYLRVTSVWTALLARHTNIAQYLLSSDLLSLIQNGQIISII